MQGNAENVNTNGPIDHGGHIAHGGPIDLNSRSGLAERINWHVDAALDRIPEPRRAYLGCSVLGDVCERAVQFEALATVFGADEVASVFPARIRRIFHRGHEAENWCIEWLRRAGFVLVTEDPTSLPANAHGGHAPCGKTLFASCHPEESSTKDPCLSSSKAWILRFAQDDKQPLPDSAHEENPKKSVGAAGATSHQFAVEFCAGRVRGHADGILCFWRGEGVAPLPLPALWEAKCLGAKGWRDAVKNGIRTAYPKYFAQMQLYMGGLRLERGLITLLNADTMDFHHELVAFDRTVFDGLISRAERVLAACDFREMLPRCATTEADVRCRLCRHSNLCWPG